MGRLFVGLVFGVRRSREDHAISDVARNTTNADGPKSSGDWLIRASLRGVASLAKRRRLDSKSALKRWMRPCRTVQRALVLGRDIVMTLDTSRFDIGGVALSEACEVCWSFWIKGPRHVGSPSLLLAADDGDDPQELCTTKRFHAQVKVPHFPARGMGFRRTPQVQTTPPPV